MKELFPPIEPHRADWLKVSKIHEIYFECCGNPKGIPVVFLHGGPGGGVSAEHRQYFDPKKYHVILFDQRGCGKSRPFAELEENTTWDLVEDIEKLRTHLEIDKWAVFGGSWGSTLALTYAQTYPEFCTGLFLRGIFLLRKKEIDWFYQEGCSKIYPDAWEKYLAPIPIEERGDLVRAYYKRLTGEDKEVRQSAAKAWATWEASTSRLLQNHKMIEGFAQDAFADAFARIECHYFINKGFFSEDNFLLKNIDRIRHLPATIIQGRYDVVCPPESAWELHQAWPEADFQIIQDAGHSLAEPGLTKAMLKALEEFKTD